MNIPFVKIASLAIKEQLSSKKLLNKEELYSHYPKLKDSGATFVTLNLDGALRGCIGSLVAYRPLLEDLISNAKAAAFEDPRFYPLNEKEFESISIEVSLIMPPTQVKYEGVDELKSKIVPFEDGVILELNHKRATFLPQVWEQLPEFELFFASLCQKAGLNENCLEKNPKISTYKVKEFK